MSITDKRLAEIRERLAAATDGPWKAMEDDWEDGWAVVYDDGIPGIMYIAQGIKEQGGEADADFIAHAPTDLAVLLAEIDRLRGECQRLANENHVYWNAEGTDVANPCWKDQS